MIADVVDFVDRESRTHGQAEQFSGQALGDGELAGTPSAISECRLEVNRARIADDSIDARCLQVLQ